MKISIVSPVYLGEKLIPELITRIKDNVGVLSDDYEILLVEDGSPDKSWEAIQLACQSDPKVKAIKLSRNFGQHYAITAGLSVASGDWIVVMDCDLQDRPEEIPVLYEKTKEGYDIVFARRAQRLDSFFKKLSSRLFYKIFGYLTDSKQDPSIANFGIYHTNVIRAILSMKDHVRFFPTMVQWVGFSSTTVDIKHDRREEGKSSYSWKKLIQLAFNNIIAFSDKPLRITISIGLTISIISFVVGLFFLFKYAVGDIEVMGYTSMIISVWFLSGLVIFILGIIGIYLGKTFDRVKERPVYIVEKEINIDK